jgi:acetyl esterase/lipase
MHSIHLISHLLVISSLLAVTAWSAQSPAPAPLERVPPGVRAVRDLAYVENGHELQKLDLFLPEQKSAAPLPLLVVVHGGGWSGGDKTKWHMPTLNLIARGYAVASLNYRLSGDAPFPAQLEDCKTAIRWLRANAKKYDLDPRHVGAWGASAGGNLVSLLGTTAGMKTYEVGAHLEQSSTVQAVCDCYGAVDLVSRIEKAGPQGAPKSTLQFLGGEGPDLLKKAKLASPLFQVSAATPPFLIMQGDRDPLVEPEQSVRFYEALRQAGVPVRLHLFRGAEHGGFTPELVEEMAVEFFGRFLKGEQPADAGAPAARRTESTVRAKP